MKLHATQLLASAVTLIALDHEAGYLGKVNRECLTAQARAEDGESPMMLQLDAKLLEAAATEAAAGVQLHTRSRLETHDEAGRTEYSSLLDNLSSHRWQLDLNQREGVSERGIFIAMTIILSCAPIPIIAPLNLAAGPMFGVWPGTFIFVGSTLVGCIISVFLSRFLLKPCLASCIQGYGNTAEIINAAVHKEGPVFIVALVRLSCVLPFGLSTYILGCTDLSLSVLLLGTAVGSFPFSLVYCYLGQMGAKAVSGRLKGTQLGVLIVGALFSIILVWKIGRIAYSALAAAAQDKSGAEKRSDTISCESTHAHEDDIGRTAWKE